MTMTPRFAYLTGPLLATSLLILSGIFAADTWAAPAAPVQFELRQPDGTIFMARQRGDEYANWTETTDGHTIVKVDDAWFYAESDNAGGLRATNKLVGSLSAAKLKKMPLHLSPTPDPEAFTPRTIRKIPRSDTELKKKESATTQSLIAHTQKVLTILVDYSDISFFYSDASFQSLIYGAGNSTKTFFLENSYNGFTIEPATESYGTANDGIIHVTRPTPHPDIGQGDSKPEAIEIVNLADINVDYSSFDTNGDGNISAAELSIVIILAGYEGAYPTTELLKVWGHAGGFSPQTLDGVTLSPYTMFGERHDAHQATVGIMAHELGHLMLGLPDLYDTDSSSSGIGDWGLMGGGSWNFVGTWSGDSPAHMNAWSKVATNFTTPQDIVTGQTAVSIPKADANEVAKRLWIDKYKVNEHFLVENRQKSGYDAGLPGDGLLIWHIDNSRSTNSDETHKWVDLEAADGFNDLDFADGPSDDGDPFPGSENNVTFDDTSNPNSKAYSGAATQIGVTGISASAATMTANLTPSTAVTGDHVRYDENGHSGAFGFGSPTAWLGIHPLNDTAHTSFDGIDVYVRENATVDISYYTSMAGGTPTGLIHQETGFAAAGPGFSRLLFATPQSFPAGVERGIVVKVVNDSDNFPIVVDGTGVSSGRSYYDFNGVGTFTSSDEDVNIVALLSTPASTCDVNLQLNDTVINGTENYQVEDTLTLGPNLIIGGDVTATVGQKAVVLDNTAIGSSFGLTIDPGVCP